VNDAPPALSWSDRFRADLISGFLVFLIALPLCLAISLASGFPATAGVFTAIVGGLVAPWISNSELTIKGPAAGLIVIVLGCVMEFGGGPDADAATSYQAYRLALGVAVAAGVLQIGLALVRSGILSELFPLTVVHGMLAAIGVIIMSKQVHLLLGVKPHGQEPLELIAEIPHSVADLNPEIAFIGASNLALLFLWPLIRNAHVRKIPAQLLVLLVGIPLAYYFDLDHAHSYTFGGHSYEVGEQFLVAVPGSILQAIATPDFSGLATWTGWKWVLMFLLIGTLESLLSAKAIDILDPQRRKTDINRDLLAVGVGNTLAACIGGLPMISEIVRSKANIDNGARSHWSNFFHGTFLLLSIVLIPGLLQQIPMAALAAMLIYTGTRLASPKEFMHVYKIGPEQLLLFVVTMIVTLATDLLVGVGAGLVLKVILHVKNGVPFRSLFRSVVSETQEEGRLTLKVQDAAIFTNYLGLKRRLASVPRNVDLVILDFEDTWVVDHTVLAKLQKLSRDWTQGQLLLTGLDGHAAASDHELAARRKLRSIGAAQGA